ncbi:hypothetical protein Cni_G06191 [Canna indica]|uniref:Reverse transcriptase zinc-binding domain-containing protein n=1 Tax=Canna indica TaxID=4628 RepID=A0AAQ3JY25_9LILI|nr:hypothetical protein Cni_G06191 [Canna indica]
MIEQEVDNGHIKAFKYKNLCLSHLFFADDIILMLKCCSKTYGYLKKILCLYSSITNQNINLEKSECFFPSDYPKSKRDGICNLLGIKEGVLPFKYLGAHINKGKTPINIQRQIINKAKKRLDFWASKNITQAGKVVLLNSVVSSIPIHALATTWINDAVVKDYVKLAREYFWKFGKKKHGLHLVRWKRISLSRHNGGLGIRDLKLVKISIHAKRILPLLNRKNISWVNLLRLKHADIHPWNNASDMSKSRATKGLFIALCKLREGLKICIGNGQSTNIWKDPWIDCIPIEKWPTFINVNRMNEVSKVCDLIHNKYWNWPLIRQMFGEEPVNSISQMQLPIIDKKDKWIWALNKKGKLNCKGAYNFLKNESSEAIDNSFNWRLLWNLKILPKIKFFLWKLVQGRLPTSKWLSMLKITSEQDCWICREGKDNIIHIFFECSFAAKLWYNLESVLSYKFEFRDRWLQGKWADEGKSLDNESRMGLLNSIAIGLWCLLKNMNEACFKSKYAGYNTLICRILVELNNVKQLKKCMPPRVESVITDIPVQDFNCGNISLENIHVLSDNRDKLHRHNETFFTAYCDAAWLKSSNKAGLGCHFLNERNEAFMKGFSSSFTLDVLIAELKVIWWCLMKADLIIIKHLKIFSDSKIPIDILNNYMKAPWNAKDLVKDILYLGQKLNVMGWFFTGRENNTMAHQLAYYGLIESSSAHLALELWKVFGNCSANSCFWRMFIDPFYIVISPNVIPCKTYNLYHSFSQEVMRLSYIVTVNCSISNKSSDHRREYGCIQIFGVECMINDPLPLPHGA